MDEREIVRTIMQDKGYTQTSLAEKAGMKRQSNVSEILRSQSMRTDNFVRLLDALECDLVVQDRESDSEWVVASKIPEK